MDEGGAWKYEVWPDLCPGRRNKLQFQKVGARPRILVRRNGPARGIYNRAGADDRFSGDQILAEVQRRLNTAISGVDSRPTNWFLDPMSRIFRAGRLGRRSALRPANTSFKPVRATVEIA